MSHTTTVLSLLAAEHGVASRQRLIDAGIPARAVDHELSVGRLVAVHPGVYRSAGTPADHAIVLRSSLIATRPDGTLSHRSAARHFGLPGRADLIELTVPHNLRPRLAGVTVHRSHRLPDHHIMSHDGLRITTVERTIGDLGAVVHRTIVRAAAETAVVRRLTTVERLFRHVDEHARRGRTGIGALRAVLEDWMLSERPPDSEIEIAFMRLVRAADLPPAHHQYDVHDHSGRFVGRADAAWPDQRVIVEIDGFSAHGTPSAMQRDLVRQNQLVLAGWTVVRFTWHDIVRRPGWVAKQIADALAMAA